MKVKTELSVILFPFRSFERFKQVSNIIHGEQRAAKDSHDFHAGTINLHIMFDDTNEAISDDGNMYLNTDCRAKIAAIEKIHELKTNRCILREIHEVDIPRIKEIFDDDDTQRFLPDLYELVKTDYGMR